MANLRVPCKVAVMISGGWNKGHFSGRGTPWSASLPVTFRGLPERFLPRPHAPPDLVTARPCGDDASRAP